MILKKLGSFWSAFALFIGLATLSAQNVIRNASDYSDEEYRRFKITLIDRPAWDQLQADFLLRKEEYPLRYTDSPAIHLIEGEPIVSLFVTAEQLPEIEENRKAGIIRLCKLVFKNKRYDEVHITLMNRDHPEMTHSITITKQTFRDLYEKENKEDKLLPSKTESIKERAATFEALTLNR